MVFIGVYMLRGFEVFVCDKYLEVLYVSLFDFNLFKLKVYNVCCV